MSAGLPGSTMNDPLLFAEAVRCPRCGRLTTIRKDGVFYVGTCGHIVYERRWKSRAPVPLPRGRHGRRSAYDAHDCRCDLCMMAVALDKRARDARRRPAS